MKMIFVLITGLLTLVSLSSTVVADNITAIQTINNAPARFDGKEVILRGVTKDPTRIPVIELKAYVLEDNSGEIIILTDSDLPEMGIKITVKVRVDSLAIIKGEALGTTVIEVERYVSL